MAAAILNFRPAARPAFSASLADATDFVKPAGARTFKRRHRFVAHWRRSAYCHLFCIWRPT
jgi:hypothetical protein